MDKNIIENKFVFINKIILMLLIFFISRFIIFYYFQIKLQTPSYTYHLLDITLLKNDLLNSLLYLHAQPTLWNLFNGIIVKIMNADISSISIFFNIYHYFLTLIFIFLCIKFLREFYIDKKVELFIFFF